MSGAERVRKRTNQLIEPCIPYIQYLQPMERGNDESMSDLVRELQARRNHPTHLENLKSARSRSDKSFRLERSSNSKSTLKGSEMSTHASIGENPSWIMRLFRSMSCTSIVQVDDQANMASVKNTERSSKRLSLKSSKPQFHGSDSQIIVVQDENPPLDDDQPFHHGKLSKAHPNSGSMMSTRSYDTVQMETSFRLSGSSWSQKQDSSFYTTPPVSYYPSKPWANEPRPDSMKGSVGMPPEMNRSQLRIDTAV